MPNKKVANFDIFKALTGITLTTAAAITGAMGKPLLTGLTTLTAVGLSESSTFGTLLDRIKAPQEKKLELLPPHGWRELDWANLCDEIEQRLPDIISRMEKYLRRAQEQNQIITNDVVQKTFIDALIDESLTLAPAPDERKKIAETIVIPILHEMDIIMKDLQPLVEQLQRDKFFKDIDLIAGNTVVLREATTPNVLTNERSNNLNKKYRKTLFNRWKMLDFKGIMHVDMNRPLGIPLTEVFVLPDLLVGIPEHETIERDDENEKHKGDDIDLEDNDWKDEKEEEEEPIRHSRRRFGSKRTSFQREDLRKVLSDQRHTVILGDPGSGKSTLLRYFLLKLVEPDGTFSQEFPQLAHLANAVPLYIQLAQYAEFWNDKQRIGERSLSAFLPKFMKDDEMGDCIEFIQDQLEKGTVLVLLDGLDEIPNYAQRIQIVRQIEKFTHTYSMNRIMVTSRIVGYKEAQLAVDYQPYTLADFNEIQIKAFAGKWCPAYERWVKDTETRYVRDAAAREAERLFQATQGNIGVKRLAVNPLMLTILAIIQRQGVELPSHRIELFELCAITLLDTWIKAKGMIDSTTSSKNDLIKILRPLAFWMHEHAAVGAIPEEDLVEQITRQLLSRKITRNKDEAMTQAENFLNIVRGKTGILVERGKNRYGFLHLTFEEYFSARELERHKDRNTFIKDHLHDPRWREAILLAIGTAGIIQSDEDDVTQIVQDAILQADSPFEPWLHRDLLFAGRCLADDIGINVELEDKIIEKILYLYITTPYDSLRESFEPILSLWSETKVGAKATRLLLPLLYGQAKILGMKMQHPQTLSSHNSLTDKVNEYYPHMLQDSRKSQTKALQLTILAASNTLPVEDLSSINEYVFAALFDIHTDATEMITRALEESKNNETLLISILIKQTITNRYTWYTKASSIKSLGHFAHNTSALAILLSLLSDSNLETRKAAVKALAPAAETQTAILNTLLPLLNDPVLTEVTIKALGPLASTCPIVLDALLPLISSNYWRIGEAAIHALAPLASTHPIVLEAFLSLPTKDYYYRHEETIIEVLIPQTPTSPTILAALMNALSSPEWKIRELAVQILASLVSTHPAVTDAIHSMLFDSKQEVKCAAIKALLPLALTDVTVLDTLLSILSENDDCMDKDIIQTLAPLLPTHSSLFDTFISFLSHYDYDSDVQIAVINALAPLTLDHPSLADVLFPYFNDDDADIQLASIIALAPLLPTHPALSDAFVPFINKLLDLHSINSKSQTNLQFLAPIISLHQDIIDKLLQALADSYSTSVKKLIVQLITPLVPTHPNVLDALIHLLSNHPSDVREEAILVLSSLASTHSTILDTLLALLLEENEASQKAAIIETLAPLVSTHPNVLDVFLALMTDQSTTVIKALAPLIPSYNNILEKFLDIFCSSTYISSDIIETLAPLVSTHPNVLDAFLSKISSSTYYYYYSMEKIVPALVPLISSHQEVLDKLLSNLSQFSNSNTDIIIEALMPLVPVYPAIIENLLSSLTVSSARNKYAIARALGQIGKEQPEIIQRAFASLQKAEQRINPSWATSEHKRNYNKDFMVRTLQLLKCVGNGQPLVIDTLLTTVSITTPAIKQASIEALGAIGKDYPHILDVLLKLPTGNSIGVRRAHAEALGLSGSDRLDVIDALLKFIAVPNSDVRRTAVEAIGQLNIADCQTYIVDKLLTLLKNANPKAKSTIIEVLGLVGKDQPHVTDTLFTLLADYDSNSRQAAGKILGQIGRNDPEVVAALLAQLDNYNPNVRQSVIRAFGQLGSDYPNGIQIMLTKLTDSDSYVRQTAVRVLGQISSGQVDIIQTLLNHLPDTSDNVKQALLETLGQIGNGQPHIIPILLEHFSSNSEKYRFGATVALGQLGTGNSQVIDALLNHLTDASEKVRLAVIDALGQIGVGNSQVIDTLLNHLTDSNKKDRLAASDALASLRGDRAAISHGIAHLLDLQGPVADWSADDHRSIDELLFALQEVLGDV